MLFYIDSCLTIFKTCKGLYYEFFVKIAKILALTESCVLSYISLELYREL